MLVQDIAPAQEPERQPARCQGCAPCRSRKHHRDRDASQMQWTVGHSPSARASHPQCEGHASKFRCGLDHMFRLLRHSRSADRPTCAILVAANRIVKVRPSRLATKAPLGRVVLRGAERADPGAGRSAGGGRRESVGPTPRPKFHVARFAVVDPFEVTMDVQVAEHTSKFNGRFVRRCADPPYLTLSRRICTLGLECHRDSGGACRCCVPSRLPRPGRCGTRARGAGAAARRVGGREHV